ncbi:hypothetical protein LQQ74_27445 (plasmid) [Escherichia coli]|nr:hypothetical protein LQQ74_27445 [Escherichia coli]
MSAGTRRLILGIIVTFSLILALICVTQPFNPLAQFIFLMLLWGGSADRTADAGALLGADADCAVADRFLPLYLVALHLDVKLGRSGQPGVRAYSALR